MIVPIPAIVLAVLFLLALVVAYIGAATRAIVLQATLDQLWPFVRSVSSALQASANGGKETECK